MSTFQTTLERDLGEGDQEITITVRYTHHRACRGARDGRGGPLIEPDEPAHIEIDSIENSHGEPVDVSPDETQQIYTEIVDAEYDRCLPYER